MEERVPFYKNPVVFFAVVGIVFLAIIAERINRPAPSPPPMANVKPSFEVMTSDDICPYCGAKGTPYRNMSYFVTQSDGSRVYYHPMFCHRENGHVWTCKTRESP